MAESIRGISVLIEGNTTGLQAALKDVNKATRDTQSELKQVEKLLKMDPGNTELIAQKQKLLAQAVENSKEKLNALKAAQQQVNEQFARGEISEGAYRAFQREVVAAEQQLASFESRLSGTTTGLNEVGDAAESNANRISGMGDKLKGVGEKMSVGVTAPILAAGGAMLKGAVDAETATGKLQAQLGITSEEAGNLGTVAQEVWKTGFGENITTATDAVKNVKLNMAGLAENELQAVATGAMVIADVFETDVTDTTKTAGTMMKNFGIDGQSAMDLITVGFQKGGDYSGELLDTLNEYSPQFSAMGMSADQMMGILISGAQAGAFNMDKVGDAVKEFNIRAQDGSKATAEGFAAIGLNADQMGAAIAEGGEKGQQAFTATIAALAAMDDPMQQNIAGTALFGTQWEDVRSKVIVAMAEGVNGIGDFRGATSEAAEAMKANNPGLALTSAMRELQAAIGPALLPLADIIQNSIVPAVKSLAEGFANLSPTGQTVVLAVAGIAAAIGPLLVVVGAMASGIGVLAGVFATVSGAITAAGGALAILTGPIGITVAAIAGLVAVGVLLYKNWDEIKAKAGELLTTISTKFEEIKRAISTKFEEAKNKITEIWGAIKEYFSTTLNSISQFFADTWEGIKTFTSDTWEAIKSTTIAVWNAIKDTVIAIVTPFANGITNIFNGMKGGLETIFNGLKDFFKGIWDVIKNIFLGAILLIIDLVTGDFEGLSEDSQAIFGNLSKAFGKIWEGIKQIFGGAIEAIVGGVRVAWDQLKANTTAIFEAVKSFISTTWTNIKTDIITTVTSIPGAVKLAWEQLKANTTAIFDAVKNFISTTWINIKTDISNRVTEIRTAVTTKFQEMKDAVLNKMGEIKTTIVNKWGEAKQFLQNIDLLQIGKNIIQGLINGVSDKFTSLKTKMENLAASIPSWMRKILGIQSPSTVMQEVGHYTIDGLIAGIGDKTSEVGTAMDGIVTTIASKSADFVAAGASIGQQFSAALSSNITRKYDNGPSGWTDYDGNGNPIRGGTSGGGGGSSSSSGTRDVDRVYDRSGNYSDYDNKSGALVGGGVKGSENLPGSKHNVVSTKTEKKHDGGWVGNLKSDEVPIIAQTGEFILSREMLKNIASIGKHTSTSTVINREVHLHIENKGTIVGRNGMDEFAKTVSKQISKDFGLATGGAW